MYEVENLIDKLDAVLIFLSLRGSESLFTAFEIRESVTGFLIEEMDDIYSILKKLVKNEYVEFHDISSMRRHPQYSITFEGKVFTEQGGYRQKLMNESSENIRLVKIENAQKQFRRVQNVLLTIVAAGTLIAAVYYIMEIGIHFHWWD